MKCLIVFMLVYFLSKTTFISSAEAPEILENDYGECRVKMYKKIESLRGNGYPNANAWPTTPPKICWTKCYIAYGPPEEIGKSYCFHSGKYHICDRANPSGDNTYNDAKYCDGEGNCVSIHNFSQTDKNWESGEGEGEVPRSV